MRKFGISVLVVLGFLLFGFGLLLGEVILEHARWNPRVVIAGVLAFGSILGGLDLVRRAGKHL